MKKRSLTHYYILIIILFSLRSLGQTKGNSLFFCYSENLNKVSCILKNNGAFKEVVYLSENLFEPNLKRGEYYNFITQYSKLVKNYFKKIKAIDYKENDSLNYRVVLKTH